MAHGQGEEVAVGLCAHACYAPRVCQQTDLAEVGAVAERGGHLAVAHHNVHNALLNMCDFVITEQAGSALSDAPPLPPHPANLRGIEVVRIIPTCTAKSRGCTMYTSSCLH